MPSAGVQYVLPRPNALSSWNGAADDRTVETVLYRSDDLIVIDRVQSGPVTDWGPVMGGGQPSIVFLRAGVIECKTPREHVLTDPTYVKCYDASHEYRRRRLTDGGEAYTLILPGSEVMQEAFGRAGYQAACGGEVHLRHLALYRALRRDLAAGLDAKEAVLGLLAEVAAAFGTAAPVNPAGPRVRRRLQAAQAHVAADPAADHRLAEVAAIAGCSEFHFARLFKAETGQSLRAYRRRLRLRMALRLISEGQSDLTSVALDTGFNTHSHMTAAFQAEIGRTPSAARSSISLAG